MGEQPDRRAPHEQLADRLRAKIVDGQFREDERIPSVRSLAASEGLAPGTVQQAINQLKREGLVITARGQGTKVVSGAMAMAVARTPPDPLLPVVERLDELEARVRTLEAWVDRG
ncbi:GntR family transcriptional regulator [Candidatus Frankia alpina]|uniref:GntR family transcriptional regulator n=1 Tax=Candidatus Frankia alpina TaxID=2699483 RepID=A0A4S5ETS4_9ACTN|nr:GntR family transcriptional regulator [Candidatus Frankia alpina]THJ75864.1 GntR family transcriptional regulator [Candidatus Frankia alpina]